MIQTFLEVDPTLIRRRGGLIYWIIRRIDRSRPPIDKMGYKTK